MPVFFLYFCVIISGAAVLILEILGTRLLGPYFGVSLYVWSSLIGVTLAALSAGYALGGRWADHRPTLVRFSSLFIGAGLLTVLMTFVRTPVIKMTAALGLRAGALAGAFLLMFPALLILGMVSPYAIRLKTRRLDEVGRSAGNLFAVSTLASVLAAVLTGFYLIPGLGVHRLLVGTGALLLGTGLAGLAMNRRGRASAAGLLLLPLLTIAGLYLVPPVEPQPARGLLAVTQSPYGEIRVLDRDGLRYMLIDGAPHTICDPVTWASEYPYVDVLEIAKEFKREPGRMLLVGLGGGSVAKSFAQSGWQVDAVEIDPVVVRDAVRWFGLKADEAAVHLADGRRFLEEQPPASYDLIIMDAFGSSSIPFHLVTREVFGLIRSRLKPQGMLEMNIEAVGWHHELVASLAVTLADVFGQVRVLPIAEPPDQLGNLILVAADFPLELDHELAPPTSRWSREYDLVHAWDNRFGPQPDRGMVLTDDHNPVDVWSDGINLVSRRDMHRFFGAGALTW